MSWNCPHQRGKEPFCERLNKLCKPLQKGCVLEGKFKMVGDSTAGTRNPGEIPTPVRGP